MLTCAIRNEAWEEPGVSILSGALLLSHAVAFARGQWKGTLGYLVVTPAEGLTFPRRDLMSN